MDWPRIARTTPVILGCSTAFAGSLHARGASPAQAAGAGLFIPLAVTGVLGAVLAIRQAGRATRPPA